MGSKQTRWYVAELVIAISVAGHTETVVHENLVLVNAGSDAEAYERALEVGQHYNDTEINPEGREVVVEFLGVNDLVHMHDNLEHGAELCFNEHLAASKESVRAKLPARDNLRLFQTGRVSSIDYRSREMVEQMKKLSRDS
jgi:hypothetical protein